jgi:hypothetical protein
MIRKGDRQSFPLATGAGGTFDLKVFNLRA